MIWKYAESGTVLKHTQSQTPSGWADKWGRCYQFNPHMGQLVSHREELCSKATDCTINPSQPSPNGVSLITRGPGTSRWLCAKPSSLLRTQLSCCLRHPSSQTHQTLRDYCSRMEQLKAPYSWFLHPSLLTQKGKTWKSCNLHLCIMNAVWFGGN